MVILLIFSIGIRTVAVLALLAQSLIEGIGRRVHHVGRVQRARQAALFVRVQVVRREAELGGASEPDGAPGASSAEPDGAPPDPSAEAGASPPTAAKATTASPPPFNHLDEKLKKPPHRPASFVELLAAL